MVEFQGVWVCSDCLLVVATNFVEVCRSHEERLRQQWLANLHQQVAVWRQKCLETLGQTSALGIAVGSALATSAVAAAGLVTGVARGAVNVSQAVHPSLQSVDPTGCSGGLPMRPQTVDASWQPSAQKMQLAASSQAADEHAVAVNIALQRGLTAAQAEMTADLAMADTGLQRCSSEGDFWTG